MPWLLMSARGSSAGGADARVQQRGGYRQRGVEEAQAAALVLQAREGARAGDGGGRGQGAAVLEAHLGGRGPARHCGLARLVRQRLLLAAAAAAAAAAARAVGRGGGRGGSGGGGEQAGGGGAGAEEQRAKSQRVGGTQTLLHAMEEGAGGIGAGGASE